MPPKVLRAEGAPRAPVRGVLARLAACLSLLLGACAGVVEAPAPTAKLQTSVDRGRFYALRSCAGCHAVGNLGFSPDSHAPAFRNLEQRVAPGDLSHRLAELSTGGHGEMPPIYMSPDEIGDLTAYLRTLPDGAPAIAPGEGRRI